MYKSVVLGCVAGLLAGSSAMAFQIPDSVLERLTDQQRQSIQNRMSQERKKRQTNNKKKKQAEQKKERKLSLALLKELYKKAEEAYGEENFSTAYNYYTDVATATLKGTEKMVTKSKARITEIDKMSRQKLTEGQLKQLQGDYAAAVELYSSVISAFPYSDVAAEADRKLRVLKNTPKAAAAVLYADALAELSAENYPSAVKKLQEIVDKYPKEVAALKAKMKLESLEKDEAVQESLKADSDLRAEKYCPKWMNTADNYIMNGLNGRAREFLLRIVAEFPTSTYADTARKKLAGL